MKAMAIAATGMAAQETNVNVISNNIANSSTTGFKAQRAEFQDLLYENIRRPGSDASDAGTIVPTGIQIGGGVRTAAVYRMHGQGDLKTTDNPLDIAIVGRGFFQIQMPDGTTSYTRAGSLQLNAQGVIVTPDGNPVLPQITVPIDATSVTINASGQVEASIDGQVTPTVAGQLQLANFVNPPGLEATGDNMFKETPASGSPTTAAPGSTGFGSIRQFTVESSNVNIVSQITDLISAQRAYEMNSRTVKTADEMMQALNQLK